MDPLGARSFGQPCVIWELTIWRVSVELLFVGLFLTESFGKRLFVSDVSAIHGLAMLNDWYCVR